jgi:hypothetical protein
MIVGPSKNWPGTMMLFWKVLGSLFFTLPLYWVHGDGVPPIQFAE